MGTAPAAPGSGAAALTVQNGSNLNGSNLNGSNLNGSDLNGSDLNGSNLNGQALADTLVSVDYAGATLGGQPLDGVQLQASAFWGTQGGAAVTTPEFAGVTFQGTLGDGRRVPVQITGVTQATSDGLWRYDVRYQEADGSWWPICKDAQGPTWAIAVRDRWDYRAGVPGGGAKIGDPDRFTFSCPDSAITKCVLDGYQPWASRDGVSLAPLHQACTRLIRADYCGDGTSYTKDGNWVNLYDALDVQRDTESWAPEAEWDEAGARCLNQWTRATSPIACASTLQSSACAHRGFPQGTLLVSEVPWQ